MLRSLAPVLAPAILAAGAHAQLSPFSDEPAAKVRLIASHDAVGASPMWLGVEFDMAPGWHIYWPGQNDSGYAPSVEWTLPEGFTVDELQWPTPKRYILPGDILDHTYEGRVVLLAKLTPPATIRTGEPVPIGAKVAWLECEEGCVPREAEVGIDLKVSTEPVNAGTEAAPFKDAQSALPKDHAGHVRLLWLAPDRVRIMPDPSIMSPISRVAFYPHESGIRVKDPLKNAEALADSLELPLDTSTDSAPHFLRGIVQCWDADGRSLGAWTIESSRGQNLPRVVGDDTAPPSPQ